MFGTILMQRVVSAALVGLPGCSALQTPETGSAQTRPAQTQAPERTPPDDITFGTQTQRGFVNDNVYHSELGISIGEDDSYYGSDSLKSAYAQLRRLYEEQGLIEEEIGRLLVLDVRPQSYFTEHGFQDQHAGGQAFAHDDEIMNWIFSKRNARTIPEELEYIPEGYARPAEHPGTLERLEYVTWESLSYEDHIQRLTKTAWVYLPYGYTPERKYNVTYLSHGGWSNETTLMGTPDSPHDFKHIMDHAIEDGKIQPLIIVLPTYNNTSESDSGNYSLALRLTDNFHNELVNDLIVNHYDPAFVKMLHSMKIYE